ncbi:hypothetical protein Salat_1141100 [Sesamum alatum]|uniref:Uncharacterized protein n=1 Tax=Sesamum alatum TaxID=300844 RepID=A0AAE1YE43_9LAMI|nr:hypothetical protein Salat_1141100 [Sesamum alatum]
MALALLVCVGGCRCSGSHLGVFVVIGRLSLVVGLFLMDPNVGLLRKALVLTKEEEAELDLSALENLTSGGQEDLLSVGRLFTPRPYTFDVFSSMFRSFSKPAKGMDVKLLGENTCLLWFNHIVDWDRALLSQPSSDYPPIESPNLSRALLSKSSSSKLRVCPQPPLKLCSNGIEDAKPYAQVSNLSSPIGVSEHEMGLCVDSLGNIPISFNARTLLGCGEGPVPRDRI